MEGQLIHNWDELFYGDNIPPWEDLEPNLEFLSLVQAYCKPGMKVLEIGCGLGHNALALSKLGIDVTATDFSKNAVLRFVKMAERAEIAVKHRVLNLMDLPTDPGNFDLIFDKGCWHSFFERDARNKYVDQICHLLSDSGIWINSSGSADNIDDLDDPNLKTYPRRSLEEIVQSVESRFEILQVRKGRYGYHDKRNFLTWEIVLKKRKS
jgi:cyclopropane fatty-acyl-phospholipid synthase-like methyltransferase